MWKSASSEYLKIVFKKLPEVINFQKLKSVFQYDNQNLKILEEEETTMWKNTSEYTQKTKI